MVREDNLDAHRARVKDALHALGAERRVCVEHIDLLPDEYVAHVRQRSEEPWERRVDVRRRERVDRDVVDLDAVRKIADSTPWRVRVRDDDHLYALCSAAERRGSTTRRDRKSVV